MNDSEFIKDILCPLLNSGELPDDSYSVQINKLKDSVLVTVTESDGYSWSNATTSTAFVINVNQIG